MNDNPQKACPFCGQADSLILYKDPNSPARVVMCLQERGGCGAAAPAEVWNQRRQPLTVYINPNVPSKTEAAPDPDEPELPM